MALMGALLLGCGDGSASGSAGQTTGDGSTSEGSSSDGAPTTSGGGSSTGAPADDCSSDKLWTMGDAESPLMHPGRACLDCHQTIVGEDIQNKLAIAGTVYPTAHEIDDCYGAATAGLSVVITTADNQTLTLPVNEAGNFMYDQEEFGPIMFPIAAKVKRGDAEIAMATPQMTGDCNSCHTQNGMSGAPGRILAPREEPDPLWARASPGCCDIYSRRFRSR